MGNACQNLRGFPRTVNNFYRTKQTNFVGVLKGMNSQLQISRAAGYIMPSANFGLSFLL